MKKILFLSVFALCAMLATLQSCKKTEAVDASNSSQSEQFYDGDEYDKGLVVEEAEEVEEVEEVDYQSEAVTKVLSITASPSIQELYNETTCAMTKYKDYIPLGLAYHQLRVSLSQKDSIISITTNRAEVDYAQIQKENDNTYNFAIRLNKDGFKTKSVKISFLMSSGKTISKSIKTVNAIAQDDDYYFYGESAWLTNRTRSELGKSRYLATENVRTNITSSYVPQIGDILFFGEKTGVVTTVPVLAPATKTKAAAYKFKTIEMNSRCTNRKYTKSQRVSDMTKIISTDGSTYATKYFRD